VVREVQVVVVMVEQALRVLMVRQELEVVEVVVQALLLR
jgi:hypothetical protein